MPRAEEPGLRRVAHDQLDALIAILDEVRHDNAHTRPELMRRTGLSRAVVAQRVRELLDRGLIENGDLGTSTRARAPRRLRLRARAGHLLVADLGATSIDVAIAEPNAGSLGRGRTSLVRT